MTLTSTDPTMRALLTAVLLTILLGVSLQAQTGSSGLSRADDLNQTVYGLGFSAGWASGIGLSFRGHLPSKSSLQAIVGIIRTSDKLSASIGGEFQYDLARGSGSRFFAGAAMSYEYYGKDHNEIAGPIRTGLGIGGEFHVQESLHVTVEGMFTFFSDGRVIPLPQVAMHYYFN
jgi:hypothetical protein